MGTKVQVDNYLPGHYSMRDFSRESNGASCPSCYTDVNLSNGEFYYEFSPRTVADSHPGYDKDAMKQTMLEHEAIFKNQVYELHRLYGVQRDLMDEVRRKEQVNGRVPYETSSSSSPVPSHLQSEDAQRWNGATIPLGSSVCGRPLISGPYTMQSSPQSAKGKSIQASPSLFQNCYSPKKSEVLESRPTKCRRRMLDLQLPADEYIDTDDVEQYGGATEIDTISPFPTKNRNCVSIDGNKLISYPGKTECQGDVPRSDLHIGKPKALADLNEPLHIEETTVTSSLDFLGRAGSHTGFQHKDLPTKLLSSSMELPQSLEKGSSTNRTLNNLHEMRTNSQHWFCYATVPEQYKGSVRSINHVIHPEQATIPCQPVHNLLDQSCQFPAFLTRSHIKGDPWKAKFVGETEPSDRSYSLCGCDISEPYLASHVAIQQGLFQPSNLGKSWCQSASSWGNSSSLMSQNPTSVQTSPYASANLSKSLHSCAQCNDLFGKKLNLNSSPGANGAFGSEPPLRNGFHKSPSASHKELPAPFSSAGSDYVDCNYSEKATPGLNNSYFKATSCIDVNPMKEMNLNVPFPDLVFDDHINPHGAKIIEKGYKKEDPLTLLPWLRGKGAWSDDAEKSRKGLNSLEPVFPLGPSAASSSCKVDIKAKQPESCKKILGVPIYETPTPKNENCAVINPLHHQSGQEEIKSSKRKGFFDMNIPCESIDSDVEKTWEVEIMVVEKKQFESASLRNHFDLNSCVTEEEMPCGTSLVDNNTCVKAGTGIDLEALPTLDNEDVILPYEETLTGKPEKQHPEILPDNRIEDGEVGLAMSAAAAIVALSSRVNLSSAVEGVCCPSVGANMDDPLNWFVKIACSSGNDVEIQMIGDDGLPEGLDDFESMILRVKECSAEEYFPKPSIPEFSIIENSTCLLTTRTRKGQARRRRQRRDFQRDILPGLTTLSRHEVTEDLQTFGGLMRATGHSWQSGPNRRNATRNGCGRGRRLSAAAAVAPVLANTVCALPLKQQPQQQLHSNNTEVGLEDRSLTGWGKTTRRPRRQRCPSGNPAPPVPLT